MGRRDEKIETRLNDLRTRMAVAGMEAALLLHHRDVLYYAGTVRPAALLITPGEAILLVRRGFDYAREETTLPPEAVVPMRGFSSVVQAAERLGLELGEPGGIDRNRRVLGTELDLIPAMLYQRLQEVFPGWKLTNISPIVLDQRMAKDEHEIAVTRQACLVADAGHAAAAELVTAGISELELAAEVEAAIRRAGHGGFQPLRHPEARGAGVLLMSGEHLTVRGGHGLVVTGVGLGPAMPYGPSRRVLRPGDLVVVDIGAIYDGYTADESRTFVVGEATAAQQALFDVAYAAEEAVLSALRPGRAVSELYALAEAVVARGAAPYFAPQSLVLPGFVGHGVGLELDEPPVLWPKDETVLRPGMVLAIEIEVSAPEPGMMVKLEDTVVVHADGCEIATYTPRELIACVQGQ